MNKHVALVLILGLMLAVLAGTLWAADLRTLSIARTPSPFGEVEYVRGEVLVTFQRGISTDRIAEFVGSRGSAVKSVHAGGRFRTIAVPPGVTEREFVEQLRGDAAVESASLNTICHAFMTPNDPYYNPYQWNFPKINCPAAWDISTGTDVIVGILDSGIAYEDHAVPSYELDTVQSGITQYLQAPDLAGTQFVAGYDFINNDAHPNDNDAHGTHVAGTVAQTTNNAYGVAGMAFGCKLMPVKILDYSGSGTAQSLADGLYWATDNGAQVINMSLGWVPGYDPGSTVHNAIQYAYNHGVVLCASSGNSGVSPVSYPAAYSEVIAVGSTRYDDARASYSQYGSALEIMGPGGDIGVDQNGDGYGDGVLQNTFTGYNPGPPEQLADPTDFGWWFYDGTSMACPHVTALCAMMIANGQTGIENIRDILHETAVDLGAGGWDQYYGYGRIDAYAALTYSGINAEFEGDPSEGQAPLDVYFTDMSTGGITSWEWDFGDETPHSYTQNPAHTYSNEGYYTVSLTVTGPGGSDTETKTDYIHATSGEIVQAYANQDIPVAGTVSGSYVNTRASDNVYESIQERESGGKPSNRYSYLEHKWTIGVAAGTSVTFYVEAHRTASSDGDDFVFAYSTNDASYTDLITVTATSDQVYSAVMPSNLSGTVYIRVTDTDRTSGNRSLDEIFIDEMYVESSTIPDVTPPEVTVTSPNGGEVWPAGTAHAITWNATDDVGVVSCEIDYTYDGGSHWYDVADLAGNPGTYAWTVPNTPSAQCRVRVTAYDAAANSDVDQSNTYFTIEEVVEQPMYANSIAMTTGRAGANSYAQATPEVVADATGLGVEGVLITGHWYGASTDTDQCTTGADGKCTVRSSNVKKPAQDFCFMVDTLEKTGYYWDDTKGVITNCITPAARDRDLIAQGAPSEFSVSGPYPNPLSSFTEFSIGLPQATRLTLTIFNMRGQVVRTLVDEEVGAGTYAVTWDGVNDRAQTVSNGIYFCRVVAGSNTVNQKLMVSR
jgi:serine protease